MTSIVSSSDNAASEHENLQIAGVNSTCLSRLFTRLALGTLGRFYKSNGVCTPISRHKIIKCGRRVRLTEAATMKFIAENTSIPVPRVYCSFRHKDRTFILMERIRGEDIPRAWKRLSEEGRQKMFAQLKAMIDELRRLTPPLGTGVESCTGGSLTDCRIKRAERFGPFKSIQDFHFWLREDLRPSDHPNRAKDQEWQDIEKMAAMQDGPWPPPVFTHADLNPCNILIRDDNVVAIIDWEFSGWYPHYWEYTSAYYGNISRTGWQDELCNFLETFPAELEMERTRNQWWGEV